MCLGPQEVWVAKICPSLIRGGPPCNKDSEVVFLHPVMVPGTLVLHGSLYSGVTGQGMIKWNLQRSLQMGPI